MKKTSTIIALLLFVAFQTVRATNITIIISGFSYSPASTSGVVGDVVTISASSNHPLVEADQANWNAGTPNPVAGGWGTKTANYTFTITTVADIYYMCQFHGGSGMKGMITVTASSISQVTASAYSISLYPNPITNGDFTVKVEGFNTAGKIMLYNEEGKLLEAYDLNAATTSIKTKLPSGAYFYTVMIGTQQVSRNKFIVANSK